MLGGCGGGSHSAAMAGVDPSDPFVSVWRIESAGESITLPYIVTTTTGSIYSGTDLTRLYNGITCGSSENYAVLWNPNAITGESHTITVDFGQAEVVAGFRYWGQNEYNNCGRDLTGFKLQYQDTITSKDLEKPTKKPTSLSSAAQGRCYPESLHMG